MNNNKILLRIAWRNIWRNRRRTVLTLLTIVIGCGMIIFNNALFYGGTLQMVEDAVALNAGHMQIQQKGYWQNKSIDSAFQPGPLIPVLEELKRKGDISAYGLRIQADCLLAAGDVTAVATLQSVDPVREAGIVSIQNKIVKGGRALTADDRTAVLIGRGLAKNLGVSPGSEVSMVSRAFDGSIAAVNCTVAGVISTGNPLYDQAMVLMPYLQAVETFAMMDYVHAVVIRLPDAATAPAVGSAIEAKLKGRDTELLRWERLIPEIVQFVNLDRGAGYIFSFILFMVVAFTILNTVQMSVFERTREFGVMLSIGTSPGSIFKIIMMESAMISIAGIMLGMLLGLGSGWFVHRHPFDYSRFAAEFAQWGVYTCVYPARLTVVNVLFSTLVCLALAVLVSIVPARRAARLNPVEASRHA